MYPYEWNSNTVATRLKSVALTTTPRRMVSHGLWCINVVTFSTNQNHWSTVIESGCKSRVCHMYVNKRPHKIIICMNYGYRYPENFRLRPSYIVCIASFLLRSNYYIRLFFTLIMFCVNIAYSCLGPVWSSISQVQYFALGEAPQTVHGYCIKICCS